MIGLLPTSLEIDGEQYEINSDFRIALLIFEAYADKELTYGEKTAVCLNCLYKEVPKNVEEALKKALWFLDGGDVPKSKKAPVKIIDWSYDESIIFPALNKDCKLCALVDFSRLFQRGRRRLALAGNEHKRQAC